MKRLIIVGAGGHGKVVAECAQQNGYEDIVFLDDNKNLKNCGKYPVVGTGEDFLKLVEASDDDTDFFVAIGEASARQKAQERIERAGGAIAILIHPDAVISNGVEMGAGTVVMAGTVINVEAKIGAGCIINTASSIDHDCRIGSFVHIAVGSHIAGNVNIGDKTWIGAGATVSNNVNICEDCVLGAGAVAVSNIETPGVYIGIPAKRMKERGKE